MDKWDIYQKAIEKWGAESQFGMAQEEAAELIRAISKVLRGKESNIEEEIADVEIMLEQLRLMLDEVKIEKEKQRKLNRLEKLVIGSESCENA
ncbi:MAG: hypothetical protein AWU54_313 [Candidatus Frackibacter sp. T328-2]|nr:MAG: hypothetical protein AWU54_313 [Candidatus Frackibacter sp. T328-2]